MPGAPALSPHLTLPAPPRRLLSTPCRGTAGEFQHGPPSSHIPCVVSASQFLKNYLYYLFVYFWLCWVFVGGAGFSLVVASDVCALVEVHSLLIAVASLVAEHRL